MEPIGRSCGEGHAVRAAKEFYGVVLMAYLGVVVWSALNLPERAATHFGEDGQADGWMSPLGSVGFSLAIGLVIFGLMPAISLLATRAPELISMPSARQKEYWTRPENLSEFQRRLTAYLLVMSGMTGLLVIAMDLAMVAANQRTPPRLGPEVPWGIGVYLAATAVWLVMFIRAGRVPD